MSLVQEKPSLTPTSSISISPSPSSKVVIERLSLTDIPLHIFLFTYACADIALTGEEVSRVFALHAVLYSQKSGIRQEVPALRPAAVIAQYKYLQRKRKE